MPAISGWRAPHRKVWWTVVCHNCHKVLGRYLLPGLQRQTTYRLCDDCSASTPQQRTETPQTPARRQRRPASA
ncbi:MAG: hypothetical protein NZ951_00235 [Dehalococcoidia bacterium]|nr:hypothetical protein [Dehalococcoidia bacterium]MDW8119073.1 hypothetical protein [Chloroflexota bacterium]